MQFVSQPLSVRNAHSVLKGSRLTPLKSQAEISEELHQIVDRLLGQSSEQLPRPNGPPFDISRENFHDSKRDFLAEFEVVEATIQHLNAVIDALKADDDEQSDHNRMLKTLSQAIDRSAHQRFSSVKPDSVGLLIRKNIVETGLRLNALGVLHDLQRELTIRHNELKDQEARYWSVKHRPANYHARTIALRLARLFARETRQKPTIGTSRDGGHPSTDFARALEEVFEVLGIKAQPRSPAEWAVDQLTAFDTNGHFQDMIDAITGASSARKWEDAQSLKAMRSAIRGAS